MVTTCPNLNSCDTSFPVWLKEDHPTVAEGEVTRKVCVRKFGVCCGYLKRIKVKNCGSYYIYKLTGSLDGCKARYCGI